MKITCNKAKVQLIKNTKLREVLTQGTTEGKALNDFFTNGAIRIMIDEILKLEKLLVK